MFIDIQQSEFSGSTYWYFSIKGKNGKTVAVSVPHRNRSSLLRSITNITKTVGWKIRDYND